MTWRAATWGENAKGFGLRWPPEGPRSKPASVPSPPTLRPIEAGFDLEPADASPIEAGFDPERAGASPITTGFDPERAGASPITTGFDREPSGGGTRINRF
jgi:hypothetical protein